VEETAVAEPTDEEVDAAIDSAIADADAASAETPEEEEAAALESGEAAAEEATAEEDAAATAASEAVAEEEAADETEEFDIDSFLASIPGLEDEVQATDETSAEDAEQPVTTESEPQNTYTAEEVRSIVSQAVADAVAQVQEAVAPALENETEETQEAIDAALAEWLAEGAANQELTDDIINGMTDYIAENNLSATSPRSFAEAYHATAPRQIGIEDVPQDVKDAIIAEAQQMQASVNQGLPPIAISAKQGAPSVPPVNYTGGIMDRAKAIKQSRGA
jgi:hypothetical protein